MSAAAVLPQTSPLLSGQWFRVAALRPRLDPQAEVRRVVSRGEVWQMLMRPDASRSFRLNRAAWALVGRCDGRVPLQRLWDVAVAELRDDAPTQDELLQILARLHAAGLMSFDRQPDFGPAGQSAAQAAPRDDNDAAPRQSLLSWRFALGCPDALLARLVGPLGGLFSPVAGLVWLAGVVAAALAAWPHAGELAAEWRTLLGTPRMLAWAWVVYPLMKALHELAHGLALHQAGARVPQWGISLLMGVPVPYVDASMAATLADRRQRMVVAGAGIMVETGLAALALGVALSVQPGAVRDLALVVVFIGAMSSLLVNANPLMRYDGYHLLCDALDLPNLARRSAGHWLHQLRVRALRLPGEAPVTPAPGEAPWLWLYAPAALLMQWSVALAVLLWLASVSSLLGWAAGVFFGWTLLGQPLVRLVRWLAGAHWAAAERRTVLRRLGLAALVLLVPTVTVPLADVTVVQGVVWSPEQALVRSGTEGFVESLMVGDGQRVKVGQPLVVLQAPALLAERERLAGRVESLQSERFQALAHDAARAVSVEHELEAVVADLARTEERIDQLTVRAQVAGRVYITAAGDLPGRHVARGELLGHVDTGEPGLVRVVIEQDRAALVTAHRGPVEVRLVGGQGPVLRGELAGQPSGGGAPLPSAALGDRSGGAIVTDPADPKGLKPAQPVLQADVRLAQPTGERIGARVHVRFEHDRLPLAWQAVRALQQQILRHFNPAQ